MTLTYEIRVAGSELWHVIGRLEPNSREGIVMDISQGRRDIILFSCEGDTSVISVSNDAAEAATATDGYVALITDRRVLATLRSDGETFERDMVSDRGLIYSARWTHDNPAWKPDKRDLEDESL